jgi:hypothetical protein
MESKKGSDNLRRFSLWCGPAVWNPGLSSSTISLHLLNNSVRSMKLLSPESCSEKLSSLPKVIQKVVEQELKTRPV